MNNKPLVSVLMPCYNHAKYVGESIESVLNQTYENFELIVADNGSTDNSYEEICKYSDRISIIRLEENDISGVGMKMFALAKGDYIAIMTSDDYWLPTKLEKQMGVFEEKDNVGVCTTWAYSADENLIPYENSQGIFIQENRSRTQWIRRFVEKGNCIAYPSAVMKRETYMNYCFNPLVGLRQIGDMFLWLRIVMEEDIYIVNEPLVYFRWHNSGDNRNMSAMTDDNALRICNETAYVLEFVLENIDDALFVETFSDTFYDKNASSRNELICEKVLMLRRLANEHVAYQETYMHYYYRHMNYEILKILQNKYNTHLEDFWEYSGSSGSVWWAQRYQNAKIRFIGECREAVSKALNLAFDGDQAQASKAKYILCEDCEREQIIGLRNMLNSIIDIWNKYHTEAYDGICETLVSLCNWMQNINDLLIYIGLVDEDELSLFGQLVSMCQSNEINLDEAMIPYMEELKLRVESVVE